MTLISLLLVGGGGLREVTSYLVGRVDVNLTVVGGGSTVRVGL